MVYHVVEALLEPGVVLDRSHEWLDHSLRDDSLHVVVSILGWNLVRRWDSPVLGVLYLLLKADLLQHLVVPFLIPWLT